MDERKGNQFWKLRSKHGRDKLFKTPQLLWDAACDYFEWCDENPLLEDKVFHAQGLITHAEVTKIRAYTLGGLCLYLKCSSAYFRAFKSTSGAEKNNDFITVIEEIEETIYNQKFTAAAADLLNPNIIARDLGLADKKESIVNLKGLESLTDKELDKEIEIESKK